MSAGGAACCSAASQPGARLCTLQTTPSVLPSTPCKCLPCLLCRSRTLFMLCNVQIKRIISQASHGSVRGQAAITAQAAAGSRVRRHHRQGQRGAAVVSRWAPAWCRGSPGRQRPETPCRCSPTVEARPERGAAQRWGRHHGLAQRASLISSARAQLQLRHPHKRPPQHPGLLPSPAQQPWLQLQPRSPAPAPTLRAAARTHPSSWAAAWQR